MIGVVWKIQKQGPETRTADYWDNCVEKEEAFTVPPHTCAQSLFDTTYGISGSMVFFLFRK